MRGNSGAILEYRGEYIRKSTSDYLEQALWFDIARTLPTSNGIRIPHTYLPQEEGCYDIEFIQGTCATQLNSTLTISALIDQILLWKEQKQYYDLSWDSYTSRLYNQHVIIREDDEVMKMAFNFILTFPPPPPTFSHGDLTLENVIVDQNKNLVLIDPNFKPNLFQSYILDLGKLLQSTHSNYHQLFNSNPGVDLTSHCQILMDELDNLGVLEQCLMAEITHIMRLKKYQPTSNWELVDDLLLSLIKEM